MAVMRMLCGADMEEIRSWPPYPGDMAQMDYALRQQGWLDELMGKPGTVCYGFTADDALVAFTILAHTSSDEAEFRIAIRADQTGRGLGEGITLQTLERGFLDLHLSHIHLIVRKNNHRGIGLYRRIGFRDRGECCRDIHGEIVAFLLMDLSREAFQHRLIKTTEEEL